MPRRPHRAEDQERERRITYEIVVDAYDADEQAIGWHTYVQDTIRWPFRARCTIERAISPLRVGEEVDVVDIAPEGDCAAEVFVLIRWAGRTLGVPLAQLEPVGADGQTVQAVEDWHYWLDRGYGW